MIKQSLVFDDLLEKKFKILRSSIILGNTSNKDDVLREYELVARQIDKIRNDVYEEKLASNMYTTMTLEEEVGRLKDLILCIQNRIDERNNFLDDYIKITSNYLDNLDMISGESSLDDYKIRLSNIDEYLNNCKEIDNINNRLLVVKRELSDKYDVKSNNEVINSKLEDELIDEFNKFISRDEYFSNLNYSEIDDEMSKLEENVREKETVLNTFLSSYDALVNAGITGAEREEYSSYVRDAGLDYYNDLEKKYILNIYKLVLDKTTEYEKLYEKRESINNIIVDREKSRKKLEVNSKDELSYFIKLCEEQFNIIKSQRFNLEEIDKLIAENSQLEKRLDELDFANNREEIVNLLDEFSVSRKEDDDFSDELITEKSDIFADDGEKSSEEVFISNGPIRPNMVVKIKEPININVNKAVNTAKLVMKKVVIVLEPKKFNSKRNKLEEAEKALEEKKETIVTSEKPLNVELDTKVNNDESVKTIDNLSEIKVDTEESNNIKIPTEIFIEEPVEEKLDLFSSKDPFTDDNEIDNNKEQELLNRLPSISNIGTVKPNSALSKIEDAVKENDGVILPTMGLTSQESSEVPIVSENYIS